MSKQHVIGDLEMAHKVVGKGDPAVFLHGLGDDHQFWMRSGETLRGYKQHLLDLRGHGGTTLGEADGTLGQLADDLIAYLETVTGPVPCVGFSAGAVVVLVAARRRPDLVPGVVVAATTARIGREAAANFERRRQAILEGRTASVLAELRAVTDASVVRHRSDLDTVWQRRKKAIGSGAGYANACSAMLELTGDGIRSLLPHVAAPTQVIGGAHDIGCPVHALEEIVMGLPTARLRLIADAGHLLMTDAPAATSAAVADGLDWCRSL